MRARSAWSAGEPPESGRPRNAALRQYGTVRRRRGAVRRAQGGRAVHREDGWLAFIIGA